MDKSMLALLSGFSIPPGLLLALHRAYKPKVNDVYKSIPLISYRNVAGIKVDKVPYKPLQTID